MPEAFFKNRDNDIIEEEWSELHSRTDVAVRAKLSSIVEKTSPELIAKFDAFLKADPGLAELLPDILVQDDILTTLRRWLVDLFPEDKAPDFREMVAQQLGAGSTLARINMPVQHVNKAWRILIDGIRAEVVRREDDKQHMIAMLDLSFGTLNIAFEIMEVGYNREVTRAARSEEAYRLFSLGQNLTQEREAQRAAIAEWTQNVLFSVAVGIGSHDQTPLWDSEFGLWLTHRGSVIFDGISELNQVSAAIDNIDYTILPLLKKGSERQTHLALLQARINEIKSLLGECFNAATRIEGGHDPLTRVLNRRFMDTVLAREVALARKRQKGLSILMVDLDHFKGVNDQHGHAGGDIVLQQCAERVLECVRLSDFVFRYGGEEFLIVLTETPQSSAVTIAERLLETISNTDIDIAEDRKIRISASIGVAEFRGHPDYLELVRSADEALYQAKLDGRNRVAVARHTSGRPAGPGLKQRNH